MAFTTKLDFSSNRQIKQHPETITVLSGGTSFGVPFSALTTGPSSSDSGITSTVYSVISTFSGNSGTTVFTFTGSGMNIAASTISAITPSNSATTQNTGNVFVGNNSTTTIDGNFVYLDYTGVSFSVFVTEMTEVTLGNYTGKTNSVAVNYLSAATLDFTGRTIWVDVSGITRTQDLIIGNNPVVGYIWTCLTPEGKGYWNPVSGASSGNTYWSASTGTYAIVVNNSDALASGILSLAEGFRTTAFGNVSHAEGNLTTAIGSASHTEGSLTTASGVTSHSEGKLTIAIGDYSHAEGSGTTASGSSAHAEGNNTSAFGDYSHAEGNRTLASGSYAHAEGFGSEGRVTASGQASHAEGENTSATGSRSHAQGLRSIASGQQSHVEGFETTAIGNQSHASGSGSTASGDTSFVHGIGSVAGGLGTVVLGNGITGTTDNYVYVSSLNINSVGSSAFVNQIRIDANGNLTTNTSDERLKENIKPITGALNKINKLQGVTYNWKDRSAGSDATYLGFIAQAVEKIDTNLVFTNKNDGYKGLHIDGIIPLLVEAVKELSSGVTTTHNSYLETQTILAEDNNIDLNYGGTPTTAIGGGITILHAMGEDSNAQIITDSDGNWITNNDFKSKALTIPFYTPSNSNDTNGNNGNITRDDDYLYIKTNNGWKRTKLETF